MPRPFSLNPVYPHGGRLKEDDEDKDTGAFLSKWWNISHFIDEREKMVKNESGMLDI